jgi:CubicO group peptidase (beta-lactamase class C family)
MKYYSLLGRRRSSHFIENRSQLASFLLANGGEYNGKRILSKQAVLDMAVPRLSTDFVGIDQFFNWGYGVYVRGNENKDFQKILKGSFGWSGAYSTHFFIDPSLNLSAVMMTNMNNDLGSGSPSIQVFEKVVREHIIDKL